MLHIMFALLLALTACAKNPPPPDTSDPDAAARQSHIATVERVLGEFIDGDRVISRYDDGTVEHVGDGLIWTGVTLAALPCGMGDDLEERVAAQIAADGGSLSRHPSRPDDASLDGALGFYRGVIERSVRCGRGAVWHDAMAAHLGLVERTGGKLNARGDAIIALDFVAVTRLAARAAGVATRAPTEAELGRLEAQVGGWAKVVAGGYQAWKAGIAKKAPACFRLHLGYLALRSMERTDAGVSSGGRASFCSTVAFAGLPLVDHWCGRGDLLSWVQSFQHDVYEYRHQRCTEFESADGRANMRTPGVDKLIAERELFENL